MTIALLILALAAAAVLIYLASLPGDYEVRRSLAIEATPQQVFDQIRDFKGWVAWSPWLMHEPDARREYSEAHDQQGGSYAWDGKHIGAGRIVHTRLDAPRRIEQEIAFVRPFKSKGQVWWELAERDGQTEVTWGMTGGMPFPLRFLIPMVTEMVGKDYELGLLRLRGLLDPTAERPEIDFDGACTRDGQGALTIPFKGELEALIAAMKDGFPRLAAHLEQAGAAPAGPPLCAIYKADTKTMTFECDIAMPIAAGTPAGDFTLKTLGVGEYFQVTLHGNYEFLGLAWHNAIGHLRMRKIRWDKSRPCLEVYEGDPCTVPSTNALITRLYIPIR